MDRRLPVYLLIDTSSSMLGDPIVQVNDGLELLVANLREDPRALETVQLAVITFDDAAREVVPLTKLRDFQIPTLVPTGMTAMGAALRLAKACANRDVRRRDKQYQGDWRPMVVLLTDGEGNDDLYGGLQDFNQYQWGVRLAGAVDRGNVQKLLEICPPKPIRGREEEGPVSHVVTLSTDNLTDFFQWISDSILEVGSSMDVGGGSDAFDIDVVPEPPSTLRRVTAPGRISF